MLDMIGDLVLDARDPPTLRRVIGIIVSELIDGLDPNALGSLRYILTPDGLIMEYVGPLSQGNARCLKRVT